MTPAQAEALLEKHIQNPALRLHCRMVAEAMRASAVTTGKGDPDEWFMTGLLHDLDWESHPDEHPFRAVEHWLPEFNASEEMLSAILAHAPGRTGKQPETPCERYLFANDELSGFLFAVARMRPNKFDDLEPASVLKKMKDAKFAAAVSREDMQLGAELIGTSLEMHIRFLIGVFKSMSF